MSAASATRPIEVTLSILHGPDAGKEITRSGRELTMGRSSDATFHLKDQLLSRVHGKFWVSTDSLSTAPRTYYTDMSRNGTYYVKSGSKEEPMTAFAVHQTDQIVKPGDKLMMGETIVKIEHIEWVPASPSPAWTSVSKPQLQYATVNEPSAPAISDGSPTGEIQYANLSASRGSSSSPSKPSSPAKLSDSRTSTRQHDRSPTILSKASPSSSKPKAETLVEVVLPSAPVVIDEDLLLPRTKIALQNCRNRRMRLQQQS